MNLTDNFTLEELVYSSTALRKNIDNTPTPRIVDNLTRLCVNVLEPVRVLLDCPLKIDSGYRSVALNEAVGSTSPHSAHLDGNAADFIPYGVSVRDAFHKIYNGFKSYDQLIIECGAWIHISQPATGMKPKYEALIASRGEKGGWVYSPA